ncbi:hypothetical protein DENSPDRAFT_53056 [Dentipellis sp. KUC8613]|nr:hypothetical protein DENSPDRAFT_53056 [Dentipellis sp. KUC8613]
MARSARDGRRSTFRTPRGYRVRGCAVFEDVGTPSTSSLYASLRAAPATHRPKGRTQALNIGRRGQRRNVRRAIYRPAAVCRFPPNLTPRTPTNSSPTPHKLKKANPLPHAASNNEALRQCASFCVLEKSGGQDEDVDVDKTASLPRRGQLDAALRAWPGKRCAICDMRWAVWHVAYPLRYGAHGCRVRA